MAWSLGILKEALWSRMLFASLIDAIPEPSNITIMAGTVRGIIRQGCAFKTTRWRLSSSRHSNSKRSRGPEWGSSD